MPQPGMWMELCPKPKGAVELGRNMALVKTRVKCWLSWSSDWNIHHLTVNAAENNIWSPESHRIILLSWKTSGTRRCAWFSNQEATSGIMKISLKLLGLNWGKGVQHRNISDYYKQKAVLKILMCFYLHVHSPERPWSANESKNKKISCRETDTSSQGEKQQHIKITLCKTTFIKMLIDIIPLLTYGAIKNSLPQSVFGPFSWLNHQFRICQTPLCRLRASPWFHLLCINKRALVPVSSRTTKAFLPLHSKFCSFSHLEKNPTQQQHGLVAMQRL